MKGTYWIGGLNVEIESQYEDIHRYCSKFQTADPPDFSFTLTFKDIELEKEWRKDRDEKIRKESNRYLTTGGLEMLAAHRVICERAALFDTFMIHGSAVSADQRGYIFTAVSGTGKSTHTRLWLKLLGQDAFMVDDDKPMIHVSEDGAASVNGTPWNGKNHVGGPFSVPLKAICLLERSEKNWIRPISLFHAMPKLMQQIYRPTDPAAMKQMMACIGRMKVDIYQMGCNMDIEAARMAYEFMKPKAN